MTTSRKATDPLRDAEGEPIAEAIVETYWPYDGPHTDERVGEALRAAAALVRYANNATQGYRYGSRPPWGPLLGSLAGSLSSVVHGLDQTLDQLSDGARRLAEDPTLYDDRRPSEQGRPTALDLAAALRGLQQDLRRLRSGVDRANSLASRLGHRTAGER